MVRHFTMEMQWNLQTMEAFCIMSEPEMVEKEAIKLAATVSLYSVRTYEEGSLEKGTIKVIKGKNIRLMTRYDIYKIYWKKK